MIDVFGLALLAGLQELNIAPAHDHLRVAVGSIRNSTQEGGPWRKLFVKWVVIPGWSIIYRSATRVRSTVYMLMLQVGVLLSSFLRLLLGFVVVKGIQSAIFAITHIVCWIPPLRLL